MHRATGNSTSLRTNSSSTIATIDKVDDNSLEQSAHVRMSSGEERDGMEAGQNYGYSSHNMPADKGSDGKMEASSETQVTHTGGSRAHGTCGNTMDRRHRVRGTSPGDVCMARTNKDDMQFHLTGDGMIGSAPQQIRHQLVPSGSGKANPPQNKAQATQAQHALYAKQTPYIEARLWAGLEPDLQEELEIELARIEGREPDIESLAYGGPHASTRAGNGGGGSGGGGSGGGQGASKKTGQKTVAGAGADSPDFYHVKKGEARMSSAGKVRLSTSKDDGDVLHEAGGGKDYVGGTPAKHQFAKILTLAGPSINGFGRIG